MRRNGQQLGRRAFVAGALAAPLAASGVAGADGGRMGSKPRNRADTAPTLDGASAQHGEVPPVLMGDVTTAPVPFGGGVLVGTDRGVYVVTDGSIESFVPTRPVREVIHAGGSLAVALLDDENFATVVGIDASAGERLWSHAPSREVYSRDFGRIERSVPGFDAAPIGDRGGDAATDVAVAAGSEVLALDGTTGDVLWTAEAESAVWDVTAVGGTVFGGTRGGSVVGFDAGDGSQVIDRQVAAPFEHDRTGTIPRSVWTVEPVTVEGSTRLAVAAEDGTVALLAPGDGSLVWQEQVVSFDPGTLAEYYRQGRLRGEPTVIGDAHFQNVGLTVAEDASRLVVDVVVVRGTPGREFELPRQELHGLDAASGSVEWSTEDVTLSAAGSFAYSQSVAGGSLLVPGTPGERTQTVTAVAITDGSTVESIELPEVPGQRRGRKRLEEGYVATRAGQLVVTSTGGDLTVAAPDGSVAWSVPRLRSGRVLTGDFLGEGNEDKLIVSQNAINGRFFHRTLLLRSGSDGSIAWSQTRSAAALAEGGGFVRLQPFERGDGGLDIVGIRRPPRTRDQDRRPLATLVHLSGADGSQQASYDLVNDDDHALNRPGQRFNAVSLTVLGDGSGSDAPDVLVGANQRVFLLDVATGDVVWERLYDRRGSGSDAEQWRPVEGGRIQYYAVGGDGSAASLVAVSRDSGQLALVEADGSGDGLSVSATNRTEIEGLSIRRVEVIPDLNGDGYDELLLNRRAEEGEDRIVVSPGDGEVLASFRRASTTTIEPASLGGGDRLGLVTFNQPEQQSRVTAYEGVERVWSTEMGPAEALDIRRPMPATVAGDVNGDGETEVAVVASSPSAGAKIQLYAPSRGELVDEIVLEQFQDVGRPPFPGIHAQQIPDQTGDGVPELGVVAATDGFSSRTASYYVVDPVEGEILLSGRGAVSRFSVFADDVGLIADDGALTSVDPSAGVSLDASGSDGAADLSWTFDADGSFLTTVRVDGRLVDQTTDTSTTVRLPPGTFEIQVAATDPDGITVYDSQTVTVGGGSMLDAALYGSTVAAFGVVFGIGLVPALRRRFGGGA